METQEVVKGKPVGQELQFADYDSVEDCWRDYALLIAKSEVYHEARQNYPQTRDLNALAAVAGKYTTDPRYASLVSLIFPQPNVTSRSRPRQS